MAQYLGSKSFTLIFRPQGGEGSKRCCGAAKGANTAWKIIYFRARVIII